MSRPVIAAAGDPVPVGALMTLWQATQLDDDAVALQVLHTGVREGASALDAARAWGARARRMQGQVQTFYTGGPS